MNKKIKNSKPIISIKPEKILPKYINVNIYALIIIFTLSFLLYSNTLNHDYALDDGIVITSNNFTKKGIDGIGDIFKYDSFTGFFGIQKNLVAGFRYRPLSIATFAVEYEFFGAKPFVSHLINALLYALTCIIIYVSLCKLFEVNEKQKWWFNIPFISIILYLAHPIHTEVVANIKGRDEIMAFLGVISALYFSIKYYDSEDSKQKRKYLIFSFFLFLMGIFSKENAITFVAIIPATIYFFRKDVPISKLIYITIPILSASLFYIFIRAKVLGDQTVPIVDELMNNPFLDANGFEKIATILLTMIIYIKLLIFPHPLTSDYYPKQIPVVDFSNIWVIISVLFYGFIIYYAIKNLKNKSILAYSIFFFLASFSIVSNIVFPIGTFMNERFMYISSLAFCIVIAYFIVEKISVKFKNINYIWFILIPILGLYSFKTIDRNRAWENNYTLFSTDAKVSTNSAKGNNAIGGVLLEELDKTNDPIKRKEFFTNSVKHLKKAVEIHPTYSEPYLLLGNAYFKYNKNFDSTIYYYLKGLEISPFNDKFYKNIDVILSQSNNADYNIIIYEKLLKQYPNRFETNYNLGILYGRFKGIIDKSIYYLERAMKINPNYAYTYQDLGVAYGIAGKFKESAEVLEKSLIFNPNNPETNKNLGIAYMQMGDKQKAEKYFLQYQNLIKGKK